MPRGKRARRYSLYSRSLQICRDTETYYTNPYLGIRMIMSKHRSTSVIRSMYDTMLRLRYLCTAAPHKAPHVATTCARGAPHGAALHSTFHVCTTAQATGHGLHASVQTTICNSPGTRQRRAERSTCAAAVDRRRRDRTETMHTMETQDRDIHVMPSRHHGDLEVSGTGHGDPAASVASAVRWEPTDPGAYSAPSPAEEGAMEPTRPHRQCTRRVMGRHGSRSSQVHRRPVPPRGRGTPPHKK